ncbi:MAG: hypothetical protein QM736_07395 [Vicinamibacterales bacterium]
MRADGHYVDFLVSRDDDDASEVDGGTREPGTERAHDELSGEASARAGDAIARSIATAASLADLLTTPLSDLSRSGIGTLLRAELFRASTLVQATRVVRGELTTIRSAVPVAQMMDRLLQGFAAERRLRHVEIASHVDLPPGHIVIGDESLLAAALNGAVVATLALLEGLPAARMLIVAGLSAGRQLTLVASQDHVLPSPEWAARAFDPTWQDRAGGTGVALGLATLHHAARVHGGDATVTLSPRGTRVGLTIPAGA